MSFAKGYLGARWLAQDENEDGLSYKVEMRGAGERTVAIRIWDANDRGWGRGREFSWATTKGEASRATMS